MKKLLLIIALFVSLSTQAQKSETYVYCTLNPSRPSLFRNSWVVNIEDGEFNRMWFGDASRLTDKNGRNLKSANYTDIFNVASIYMSKLGWEFVADVADAGSANVDVGKVSTTHTWLFRKPFSAFSADEQKAINALYELKMEGEDKDK